jgi:hypothetical protein
MASAGAVARDFEREPIVQGVPRTIRANPLVTASVQEILCATRLVTLLLLLPGSLLTSGKTPSVAVSL